MLGMVIAGIGPLLPGLGRKVGASPATMSYLFPARASGYILGAIVGGFLCDRVPGATVLGLASVFLGLASFAAALSSNFYLLCVMVGLVGTFAGIIDTALNTVLVWAWGADVATPMATMHFFFGVGAFVSPLFTALALEMFDGDVRPALYIQALFCLPAAIGFLSTPSPSTPTDEETNTNNGIEALATSNSDNIQLVADKAKTGPAVQISVAVFVSLFLLCAVGCEVGYGGWLSTYAISRYNKSETTGAIITSFYWGSLTFGRGVSIPLSQRVSPQVYLLLDLAIGLLASIILVSVPSEWGLWLGASLMGVSIATMFPSCVSLPPSMGLPVTGSLTSLFVVGSSVGELLIPFLLGQSMIEFGPMGINWCMLFLVITMACLLLTLTLFMRRLKKGAEISGRSKAGSFPSWASSSPFDTGSSTEL